MRLLLLSLLAACDPSPALHVAFVAPPGTRLDVQNLHVESDFVRASGARQWEPNGGCQVAAATRVECTMTFGIGSHFDTWVRGWYDTNGNGQHDAGDLGGELRDEPFEITNGGENRAPDIGLVPLQP